MYSIQGVAHVVLVVANAAESPGPLRRHQFTSANHCANLPQNVNRIFVWRRQYHGYTTRGPRPSVKKNVVIVYIGRPRQRLISKRHMYKRNSGSWVHRRHQAGSYGV